MNKLEQIDNLIEDIYNLRKEGMERSGEYDLFNLIFKEFRNLGYLDNLKELRKKEISKDLSLEQLNEKFTFIKDNNILEMLNSCINNLIEIGFNINKEDFIFYKTPMIKEAGYLEPKSKDNKYKLVLSSYILKDSPEILNNIIYHELCHYLQLEKGIEDGIIVFQNNKMVINSLNKNYTDYLGHGKIFIYFADKINRTLNINITDTNIDIPSIKDAEKKKQKYILICKNCKEKIVYYNKSKFIKELISNKGYSENLAHECLDGTLCHYFYIISAKGDRYEKL